MKFYIQTLGCKVNTYESNVIKEILEENNYIESNDNPDVIIINTCTVTNTADNKSLKLIRQSIKKNPKAILVVVGCMPQTGIEKLKGLNIDIILGNKNKTKILDYIYEFKKHKKQIIDLYDLSQTEFECMKLNNFDKTRAFVKIQDGCENFCSYCIIPYTRGNQRSKPPREVKDEIKELISRGHQEIVLTGIHTGHYGSDLKDYDFADLLCDIVKIKGLLRLRISSIEITELNDKVLEVIKNNPVLVDHLHIPMQTGNDKILALMNRKYNIEYFSSVIDKIRKIRPDAAITTDVIVGFPNETEEDYNETLNTIQKLNFAKIHVFPYSNRKGTVSDKMLNQVDDKTKKDRAKNLIKLSKKLEENYMDKFINKEMDFISETYKDGFLIGHTGNYLLIKAKGNITDLNKQMKIKIEKTEYPYCISTIL